MAKKVNLDAFIPREDFEVLDEERVPGTKSDTISITDLKKDSFFFSSLRKPDFQRETNEWDTNRICHLVESFLDGDLIPAVILWQSANGYTFIIDGSHRISAIAAWINDDYGDKAISRAFYDGILPQEQIKLAENTRRKIQKSIGDYSQYELALKSPEKVPPEIWERAKRLGARAIRVQWLEGDAKKAEQSFFKINQQAVPIDNTELRLLEARSKPNGIAARAIVRSGKGHKYWSRFSTDAQSEIQSLAEEINNLLFQPWFKTPVKTLDLPIGGKIASAQGQLLVLEFVNMVNQVNQDELTTDINGQETIKYLKNCRKIARIINSEHPSSLGLHPIVYFYSKDGRHKIASFFAVTSLVMELEEKKKFGNFIKAREVFESVLLEYDFLVQQIVRKFRSAMKAYPHVQSFYLFLIEKAEAHKSIDELIQETVQNERFNYLTTPINEYSDTTGQEFSIGTKSAVFITQALDAALKCSICNGYLHINSISYDHVIRKSEGGLGTFDNAQLTHPYCNSAIKN